MQLTSAKEFLSGAEAQFVKCCSVFSVMPRMHYKTAPPQRMTSSMIRPTGSCLLLDSELAD